MEHTKKLEEHAKKLEEQIQKQQLVINKLDKQVRFGVPPDELKQIEQALFLVLGAPTSGPLTSADFVGCGFFIAPTQAVTAYHNISINNSPVLIGQSVHIYIDKAVHTMSVKAASISLDLVVLEPSGTFVCNMPLQLSPTCSLERSESLLLVSFSLSLHKQQDTGASIPAVSVSRCSFTRDYDPLILYCDANAGVGDSGGAVLVGSDLQVVGLHLEGVNEAKERRHTSKPGQRIPELESSLDSVIKAHAIGFVALKSTAIVPHIHFAGP